VSERERFSIESTYYLIVTGELDRAVQVYEKYLQVYPNDEYARLNLSSAFIALGQYDHAATALEVAVQEHPSDTSYLFSLAGVYVALDRLDEASRLYDRLQPHMRENPYFNRAMYYLAFLRGDTPGMLQRFNWSMARPGEQDAILATQATTEYNYGHLLKARELSLRAVDTARRRGAKQMAARWQLTSALNEAELGNATQARQLSEAALAISRDRNVILLATLTLSRTGDLAQAHELMERLNRELPRDVIIQGYVLPTAHAMLALNHGDGRQALDLLTTTVEYELAQPSAFLLSTPLYPAYIRGQAYLRIGEGRQSALEFQKIIGHPGLVGNYPFGALAHLQIGRAYALAGDAMKAKAAYTVFLSLWKEADPQIPILKQAKAEFARLH
jgi:tetratricopeptide (TPR) repeat protein